ncbi:MAG TPA: hypothetical protein VJA94_23545 [Candidatus Angelobacter sp.]
MKKIGILAITFLFSVNGFCQQPKPSPVKPQANTPELKPTTKPQPSANVTASSPILPIGTPIRMKLETPLSTSSTSAGGSFSGRITQDVKLNDKVILPVGASLQGQVIRVSEPRRIKGKPMIQLLPESVTLPNGQKCAINAAVVDTNKINGTSVDDEGRIKGPGHTDRDVMEIGAGTGVGAIVGGIAAGGKGSLIGAGIGAGGTIIHWLTKRNSASLPAGSEIIFELNRPMMVEQTEIAEK